MSRNAHTSRCRRSCQFAELEDRRHRFSDQQTELGLAARPRAIFGFDDSPSRKEAADNFTRGDGSAPEDGTLLKLHCNLWATIDWSRPDVGQQIETGLHRMAEFLQQTADAVATAWSEDQTWHEDAAGRGIHSTPGRTALPTGVNHDGRFSVPLYGQANPQDPEVWELVL